LLWGLSLIIQEKSSILLSTLKGLSLAVKRIGGWSGDQPPTGKCSLLVSSPTEEMTVGQRTDRKLQKQF